MKQTMPKGRKSDPKVTAAATRKTAAKNSDQKLAKQPTKTNKDVSAEKAMPKSANMVTLTKSEFDAIMETIGKLSMASGKIDSQATENQRSTEKNNQINSEDRERGFLPNPNNNERQQNLPLESGNPRTGIPKAHLSLAEKKRLEWQQENDSAAVGWYNREDNQKTKSDPRPTREQRQTYDDKRIEEQKINSTPRFLTPAEKKKLQWQKERAELSAMDKYDPWGRAGGGAPIKDLLGNVVNDYTKRQDVLQNLDNQPWTEPVSNFKAVDPTGYPSSRHPTLQKAQSHPDRMDAVANGVPPSQGPMMSSFRSGALASDAGRGLSEKDRQKLEWLEDLEKQREEQRQRKLLEKRGRQEESPERYYWAEKSVATNRQDEGRGHPPQPAAPDPHGASRWDDPSTQGQVDLPLNELNRHSAPPLKSQGTVTLPAQNPYNANSTFMHGQNRLVDPVTKNEQEEKRRKYLEMQEYNRKVVEEREQQKKEEKERRIREDQEEERRFNQTKQISNPTTNVSLPKTTTTKEDAPPANKEELERRREESLRQALEAARLEAEREKKQRLIEKLRKGNHDVSHLEAKLTSRSAVDVANTTRRPLQDPPSRQPNPGVPTYVEPKFVPGLGDMSSVPNVGPSHPESYGNNYRDGAAAKFTPTSRGGEEKASREFGTQTDIRGVSRESTQAEYQIREKPKSNNNSSSTKKVRVVSAPKPDHKKERQAGGTSSKASKQNQGERPRWGYSNTGNKKPVKQSERDAFHGTQERLQRRIDRQHELLGMVARNADLVPDYRAPTLSRARSRSFERGTEEQKASREINRSGRDASRHSSRSLSHSPVHRNRSPSHSPVRRNRSQSRSPVPAQNVTNRSSRAPSSPPLPSIRRHGDSSHEVDKYRDRLSVGGASQTNFVPFVRSSNVLNPAHAESPLPMSREPTEMEKARRAYQGVLQPAKYGQRMESNYQGGTNGMDPLLNPSLVTAHPTHRQGQILQHLSTLRQALREKQKQMNSISSEPMPDQYGGRRIVSPLYD